MLWNLLFNIGFERWERHQARRARTWQRRLLHALGFEGGLTLILLPVIAGWLGISWQAALVTDLALFGFYFFYALLFQWSFDRVFGAPSSVLGETACRQRPAPALEGRHRVQPRR